MRKQRLPAKPLDMCNGAVIPQMLRFAVPLMLTGVLQLLYNAADIVVVGQFAGSNAIASVGATSSLINLLVNVFMGLSVGANVVIARAIGAKDEKHASTAAHTALTVSVIIGVVLCICTLLFADQFLLWMDTPAEVLPGATLYLRIFACGFPVSLLYNFGAAILRACGDTRRPMYFLLISGAVNVVLNLCFVIVFNMAADGVALATVLSQVISAVLVVLALIHMRGPCRLSFKRLRVYGSDLIAILKIGVPAGIQSGCFGLSNVLIQSSINTFGPLAIAANTAASNIEGFEYTCFNAISQSCLTFVGQNMGAKKTRRIPRIIGAATTLSTLFSFALAAVCILLAKPLLSIYTSDPQVIEIGTTRLQYICSCYVLCAWMEIFSHSLRAMGISIMPMITCILGVCGLRIAWIYTVFEKYRSLPTLYLSWPITWIITLAVLFVAFWIIYRKMIKKEQADTE